MFLLLLIAFIKPGNDSSFVSDNFKFADEQLKNLLKEADKNELAFPKTTDKTGKLVSTNMYDWTPGFFPGNLGTHMNTLEIIPLKKQRPAGLKN